MNMHRFRDGQRSFTGVVTLDEGLDRLRPGMAADVHLARRGEDS